MIHWAIMKIGIILHQHKFFGGGPRIALELAQSLQKKGHAITLYAFRHVDDGKATFDNRAQGLRIITLPSGTNFKRRPFLGLFYVPGTSAIFQYLQENRLAKMLAKKIDPATDALLPQTSKLDLVTAYHFTHLHKKQVPIIWQMNDMTTHTFKVCHAVSWTESSCSLPEKLWYGFLDRLDRRYFAAADEITVLADMIKKQARDGLGREATVARVGVNTDQFTYKERKAPQEKTRILGHAQFYRHRRFEDAVEAVALLIKKGYDIDLTLSGDSETYEAYRKYRDEIADKARVLGIAHRVHFPGRLTDEAYLKILHASDIFIFPHVRQSWGLVPFEAMATGLPIVASNETGASEVLIDGETALIVKAEDPQAIAKAIANLVDNPDLYAKLSRNGAVWVRKELTWDHYAETIIRLIKKHRSC
ncbi:MAG: group 1 glycosyl transferase [Parcubacteria group bacterium Gr01-1014_48]|nr:MAG: group 1 glycosyl transferase [Parcubacteria group bacterium Greene0416_14]TSC74464.1 MAG: group 1 glycosyl transferase [Parcubacteria group bacterium Gr01-1014_48]TSD01774.1 MAG: group 1 glycosyl transferase [Parcubacteria group bacterium Greene1014_15]TSD08488.1 MAG: group 1 glycosyl transferase [Parcubacteria group bacterium Greene0714_4]